MPEGPEVTIISENLNQILKNSQIVEILLSNTGRYREKAPDNFIFFQENLPLKIKNVSNKGKLIYFQFEKNISMVNTLGMSGIWRRTNMKHMVLEFKFLKNGEKKSLFFIDQRHFGTVKFFKNQAELNSKLSTIGPDMLNDKDMKFDKFLQRMRSKNKWNITKALMDQKVISGVGNYLKSEALYHSKTSPFKKVEELSDEEMKNLYKSIRLKIVSSYNTGGVSVRHFTDVDDKMGQYQFKFEVYGRKRDPFGNKVICVTTPDGRTTHYVEEVQLKS